MKYQVGDLTNYTDNDPTFDDLSDALTHADNKSLRFYEEYFGVWDEDGELLSIHHQGVRYTP